jgi:hypothetical protein
MSDFKSGTWGLGSTGIGGTYFSAGSTGSFSSAKVLSNFDRFVQRTDEGIRSLIGSYYYNRCIDPDKSPEPAGREQVADILANSDLFLVHNTPLAPPEAQIVKELITGDRPLELIPSSIYCSSTISMNSIVYFRNFFKAAYDPLKDLPKTFTNLLGMSKKIAAKRLQGEEFRISDLIDGTYSKT